MEILENGRLAIFCLSSRRCYQKEKETISGWFKTHLFTNNRSFQTTLTEENVSNPIQDEGDVAISHFPDDTGNDKQR